MIGPLETGDVEVDAQALGLWLGIDARTIRKLADRDVVVKTQTRGRYHLKQSILNYCAMLRKSSLARAGREGGLNNVAEAAALKKATRELVEIRRDAILKKLIPIEDIRDAWGTIVRNVRAMVLSIPGRCREEMPHLSFEDFEKFRSIVRAVLTEAAGVMPDQAPIPDGPDATIAVPRERGRPPGPSTSLRP
jgi:phage terminase Nu1 subunit (DNA packaging protein)